MKAIIRGVCCWAFILFFQTPASAREWTSAKDGKKIEAEFVSAEGANVTIKMNGKTFTVPITRFVAADQDFVKEQMTKPAEPKALVGPYADKITGDWVLAEHDGLPYAIYGSKSLDAAKKYPLVLALHGKSDNNTNGNQVGGWMKTFSQPANYTKNPCIIVVPLCYQPHGGTGGGWSAEPGKKALDLTEDLIKNLPVDKDRVYVFGYSMGGFGSTYLVSQNPKMFAAAIAVAGCSSGATGDFKRKPIWLFHAADDAVVNVSGSRDFHDAVKRNKQAKYTEYETGGHGIAGKVFNDPAVHTWLFSHRKK